ncbi:hypothetical protein CAC42_4346 [Sphaceloma murrayae]|uniref:F-box domain-containing protein n=1 Tax=Sphaceloma murrayae TaxID=2082308 RepID=A0A2K1QLA8_9PEZI|nr:hypothetical protein CAC42_4346 [Sphaceloma murrayae]
MKDLLPEILDLIVRRLDISDLRNVRLTDKCLDRVATVHLFHELVLKPTLLSMQKWRAVLNDTNLRQIPTSVTIWSYRDVDLRLHNDDSPEDMENIDELEEHDNDSDLGGLETDEYEARQARKMARKSAFKKAIASLKGLPRLTKVQLRSTADVCGTRHRRMYWVDLYEDSAYRLEILTSLFSSIQQHNEVGNSTIQDLTLRNLQNMSNEAFTSSDAFTDVMSKLAGLHIQSTYEYNDHGPDQDLDKGERQSWHPHLLSTWIRPLAGQLKRLSLYDNTNWGLFPGRFDTEGLDFPQLEELSLGYYTIAHDDQLDWVLRCKTLKALTLHDVMILSHISIATEHLRTWSVSRAGWQQIPSPRFPDDPLPSVDGTDNAACCFRYKTKWAYFFDRISGELPRLTQLHVGDSTGHPRADGASIYDIQNRHDVGLNLTLKRYVAFWDEVLPDQWKEAELRKDGMIEWARTKVNPQAENHDEDSESFQRLCRVIEGRRASIGR